MGLLVLFPGHDDFVAGFVPGSDAELGVASDLAISNAEELGDIDFDAGWLFVLEVNEEEVVGIGFAVKKALTVGREAQEAWFGEGEDLLGDWVGREETHPVDVGEEAGIDADVFVPGIVAIFADMHVVLAGA